MGGYGALLNGIRYRNTWMGFWAAGKNMRVQI